MQLLAIRHHKNIPSRESAGWPLSLYLNNFFFDNFTFFSYYPGHDAQASCIS